MGLREVASTRVLFLRIVVRRSIQTSTYTPSPHMVEARDPFNSIATSVTLPVLAIAAHLKNPCLAGIRARSGAIHDKSCIHIFGWRARLLTRQVLKLCSQSRIDDGKGIPDGYHRYQLRRSGICDTQLAVSPHDYRLERWRSRGEPVLPFLQRVRVKLSYQVCKLYLFSAAKFLPSTSYLLLNLLTIKLTCSVNIWARKGKMWDVLWVSR